MQIEALEGLAAQKDDQTQHPGHGVLMNSLLKDPKRDDEERKTVTCLFGFYTATDGL